MNIALFILSVCMLIAGTAGCILPLLPGVPVIFGALILLEYVTPTVLFHRFFFLVWGCIVIISIILEYCAPIIGAKVCGASRLGTWGSGIGMLIGLFFFPPLGFLLGIICGALIGEYISSKSHHKAFIAALASSSASIILLIVRLSLASTLIFYFIKKTISLLQ